MAPRGRRGPAPDQGSGRRRVGQGPVTEERGVEPPGGSRGVAPLGQQGQGPVTEERGVEPPGGSRGVAPLGQQGQGPVTEERGVEPPGGSRGVAPLGQQGQGPVTEERGVEPSGGSGGVARASTAECPSKLASVIDTTAVEICDLVKRYGHTTAVDGLSLRAGRGAVTAVLGPNGAGKTTTIEICEGYRRPDAGADARALHPRVGVMLQSGGIPPAVRPGEYLGVLARFHAHPLDPVWLLDRLGLSGAARTQVRRLSGGQQQRVSLAAAVIGRPELVFLDEPT